MHCPPEILFIPEPNTGLLIERDIWRDKYTDRRIKDVPAGIRPTALRGMASHAIARLREIGSPHLPRLLDLLCLRRLHTADLCRRLFRVGRLRAHRCEEHAKTREYGKGSCDDYAFHEFHCGAPGCRT